MQDGVRMSYAALWALVESVAAYLAEAGLQAGDRAALLLENSPEYIAVYYGILAAGGVVVALNTSAKSPQLANWIAHSGASWLFADARHPEFEALRRATEGEVKLVAHRSDSRAGAGPALEQILAAGARAPRVREPRERARLAAILYTSGTTGRPKGVMLSHANLASNVASILSYLQLTEADRGLNVLPFYYAYGNSVLHTHLAAGACLVLENSLLYPHRVLSRIPQERITGFAGVPSTYALLMSQVHLDQYDTSSLRYMTQAGGAMPRAHIARLRELLPHVDFIVMYGQTEATARLTYLPPARLPEKIGSVGIPIPGVAIEIRDAQGRRLPPGVTGEIYARGDNVKMGYWRDPQATRQTLRDGWLRTGDLGHSDAEGYLYIDGRCSEIIKSGAHRISPYEIEEIIAALDGVQEVAVVPVPDEVLGQVLKAVVVPRGATAPTAQSIKAHCRRHLPLYKIPRQIEFVGELPKTASGKVRRYLLVEHGAKGDGNDG